MCPFCISVATVLSVGTTSGGGAVALPKKWKGKKAFHAAPHTLTNKGEKP